MGRKQAPILNQNTLKLDIFSANCSGGMAVTKVPERWVNSWENNIRLAKLADAAGIEFLLPIARWIGYGGETDFHGSVLETLTWATGLLAHTKRINIFATVHTAFIHPVVAAKQLATADQLGEGRLGLNVVAGWNKPEYDAFGINLPEKHADRYALAQEWFDVVTRIWNHQGPFDWDGQFFDLKNVYGYPRPFDGRPPVMNAAGSGEGRNFAVRNADFLFAISVDLDKSKTEVDEIKQRARAMDRTTGVFTLCHVVCRPTRKEAEDYYQYYSTKMRPEISGTVGSVEKPNVCGIEEVKCLGDDLQLLRFANREGSRKAQVYRTEIVASESIPRLDAHTVAVAKNVAVHVRAGKFGESLWRLNRDDGAKHKVPRRRGQPDESAGTQFFQEGSPNPLYGTPRALFNPRQIQLAFLSGVT